MGKKSKRRGKVGKTAAPTASLSPDARSRRFGGNEAPQEWTSHTKKFMNLDLDREWTSTIVSHVKACRCPVHFVEAEQDGFSLTDMYACSGCCQALIKRPCNNLMFADEEEENAYLKRQARHNIVKRAALGLPPIDVNQFIIMQSATDEEKAAALEEPVKSTMIELEIDREWTQTLVDHVIRCGGGNVKYVGSDINLFETTDRYECQSCGATLRKHPCRNANDINTAMTRAISPTDDDGVTALQLYGMYRCTGIQCPTLEELTELVSTTATSSNG